MHQCSNVYSFLENEKKNPRDSNTCKCKEMLISYRIKETVALWNCNLCHPYGKRSSGCSKVRCRVPIRPGNSTLRFALKRSKKCLNRSLYTKVHNIIIQNIKMVQTGVFIPCVLIQWASWKGTSFGPLKDTKYQLYAGICLSYCNRRLRSPSQPPLHCGTLSQNINDKKIGKGYAYPSSLQQESTWQMLAKRTEHRRQDNILSQFCFLLLW